MRVRKERPLCRRSIHKKKLRPYVENGIWDGVTFCTANDPQGHFGMTDGMTAQMRKMAEEGVWGEIRIVRNLWYTGEYYRPFDWSKLRLG